MKDISVTMKDSKFNNDIIIEKNVNDFNYFEFLKLNDLGIQNAYTLKDLDFGKKETNKDREKNYLKLADLFNINLDQIVYLDQTHSDKILVIQKDLDLQKSRSNFDGIITTRSDVAIMTFNADCILFSFYDMKNKVLGNVHSGWKGTIKRIIEKTLIIFQNEFKSNLEDIIVCISPSIRTCHFEVKEDVKSMFEKEFKEIDSKKYIKEKTGEEGTYYIDTIFLNKKMMIKMGVLEENIYDSNLCSVCEKDKIHSYRGAKEEDKDQRSVFVVKMKEVL